MSDDGIPRFYGIYRGRVAGPPDPEGRHRLQIIVPAVGGSNDSLDWALPCFQPIKPFTLTATTGASAHTHTVLPDGAVHVRMPALGDAVWVMFEAGDARRPVWLGSWMFT